MVSFGFLPKFLLPDKTDLQHSPHEGKISHLQKWYGTRQNGIKFFLMAHRILPWVPVRAQDTGVMTCSQKPDSRHCWDQLPASSSTLNWSPCHRALKLSLLFHLKRRRGLQKGLCSRPLWLHSCLAAHCTPTQVMKHAVSPTDRTNKQHFSFMLLWEGIKSQQFSSL